MIQKGSIGDPAPLVNVFSFALHAPNYMEDTHIANKLQSMPVCVEERTADLTSIKSDIRGTYLT
jgi:hypothetical protein